MYFTGRLHIYHCRVDGHSTIIFVWEGPGNVTEACCVVVVDDRQVFETTPVVLQLLIKLVPKRKINIGLLHLCSRGDIVSTHLSVVVLSYLRVYRNNNNDNHRHAH